jgi:hypothetical protein
MPLGTISEMEMHLRPTILDCDGGIKASAEGDCPSGRCVNSKGPVKNIIIIIIIKL